MSSAAIPSPGLDEVAVGPLTFHVYGLLYVVAILAAVLITRRRWRRAGGDPDVVVDVAIWAVPAGIVGARLYHVVTSWSELPDAWWGPLAVWRGGLGVWGGIAAGTLAGIVVLRRRGADVPRFLDAAAPGLLVAQAIGRLGNWFNQELYGRPTALPWGLEIDASERPAAYADAVTFHPVFLYELLWNLGLAGALVWLGHHRGVRPGGLFALYVAGYSLFRIVAELALRIDPSSMALGLRLNAFVAAGLLIAALAAFARIQRGSGTVRRAGGSKPVMRRGTQR